MAKTIEKQKALSLRKLGKTDQAHRLFEKVVAENHKAYYFAKRKAEVNLIRFYQSFYT